MVQKCWTMIKSHHCMVLWDTSMLLTLFIEINNKIMHNSINSFFLPHLSSNSLAQWVIRYTTDQWVTWMSSNLTGIFKFLPFPNYLNRVFWSVRKILMLTIQHILGQKQILSLISLGRYTGHKEINLSGD